MLAEVPNAEMISAKLVGLGAEDPGIVPPVGTSSSIGFFVSVVAPFLLIAITFPPWK
jgi:hypothetical protein